MTDPSVPATADRRGPRDSSSETVCYLHPDRPTKLRCSRCDRPICGGCAIPASVGQHCPYCVAEARKSQRKVRSTLAATAPVVRAIILVNVGVYILQFLLQGAHFTERFYSQPTAIYRGEYYRLITATFLHLPPFVAFGILHIFFNMAVLSIYGSQVEQAYGSRKLISMYLLAGLAASATSYAFNGCANPSLGASGAVFGMLGALAAYLYKRRRSQFVRDYLRSILSLIAINLVFGFVVALIDNYAHMGGLVAGAAMAWGLDPDGERVFGWIAVAATVAITLALVVWRTQTFSC